MTEFSRDDRQGAAPELTAEKLEGIRGDLRQAKRGLAINQQILFKHAAALPPAKRTGVYVAGWGPIVLFPFGALLYFVDWKLTLFTIFLSLFWVGMGRRYAQWTIRRQCLEDSEFLRFALSVGLVKIV